VVKIAAVQFGFSEARRNLAHMGAAAMDLEQPLDDLVDDITEIEERIFSSGGRRGGGMWRRPTMAWQRRKSRMQGDPRTLHSSRRLRRSVTYRGNPEMFLRINGREGTLQFGSKVPYARAHQKGLGHMPKRPFIKFLKTDHARFAKKISKYIAWEFKGRAKRR
jgi:phage gpG-like protein